MAQLGGGMRFALSNNYLVQGALSNDLILWTATSNQSWAFGASNSSNMLMRITSNGFVGIGASNPVAALDVRGDASLSNLRLGGNVLPGGTLAYKNLVPNGDMSINRGGAFTLTNITAGPGTAYLFENTSVTYAITAGAIAASNVALSVSDLPYSSGIRNSLRLTATTAVTSYSYVIPQMFMVSSGIGELRWGSSSGSAATLSFWLRTNLANSTVLEFSMRAINSAGSWNTFRGTFTVTNSGGWQAVTAAIPAPGTGAAQWPRTMSLEMCSRNSGMSGVPAGWQVENNTYAGSGGTTGSTFPWGTINNYIEFTGVQLESGSSATGFVATPMVTEQSLSRNVTLRPTVSNLEVVGNVCAGNLGMFRNRLINGDCRFCQRFGTATQTVSQGTSAYVLDRWSFQVDTGGWQVSMDTTGTLPGFQSCIKVVQSTAGVVGSGTNCVIQKIEGLNMADLCWGGMSAQPLTLSFWVKCTVAGTYNINLQSSGTDVSYIDTYTVPAANVWQCVTLTIPGATIGTWNIDNTIGMYFRFGMTRGNAPTNTLTRAWIPGVVTGAASVTTAFTTTANATVWFTGVQLEKGAVPTPFEFRPYPVELQLCQRYYEKSFDIGTVPAVGLDDKSVVTTIAPCSSGGASCASAFIPWKVIKRANPTVSQLTTYAQSATAKVSVMDGTLDTTHNGAYVRNVNGFNIYFTSAQLTARSTTIQFGYTVDVEL